MKPKRPAQAHEVVQRLEQSGTWSADELARLLETLAQGLRRGRFTLGGPDRPLRFSLLEDVHVALHLTADDAQDTGTLDLDLRWRTVKAAPLENADEK